MTKRNINNRVSVIIPSRAELYLSPTVADFLGKAEGDVEVIIVLDGYNHYNFPDPDKRIRYIQLEGVRGLRAACNAGFAASTGAWIMKADAHCMICEGWDSILKETCADNWIMVPRRYWLDPVRWEIIKERGCVTAMQIMYPYTHPYSPRIVGRPWEARAAERANIPVDEDMSFQGSLYFMSRAHWQRLGQRDETGYGTFGGEPEEIGLKTQLGPWEGKIMRNKNIWYAHWGKPNCYWNEPEKYNHITPDEFYSSYDFVFDYWFNNRWSGRAHDFEWLIDQFWPIPGWYDDWRTRRPRKL